MCRTVLEHDTVRGAHVAVITVREHNHWDDSAMFCSVLARSDTRRQLKVVRPGKGLCRENFLLSSLNINTQNIDYKEHSPPLQASTG
jgi:hypothetical protein